MVDSYIRDESLVIINRSFPFFLVLCGLLKFSRWQIQLLLGSPSVTDICSWSNGSTNLVSYGVFVRVSLLLRIIVAVSLLTSGPEKAGEWFRLRNKKFENKSALDVMLQGGVSDLKRVCDYVEHYAHSIGGC